MYVYVTMFSKYPGLIKIGKSINPDLRTPQLVKHHGQVISSIRFMLGESYHEVETELHKKYNYKRSKGVVRGDGQSEFFCASILDAVTEDLVKYEGKKDSTFNKSIIEKEIKLEEIRCANLVARLLGVDSNPCYGMDFFSPYGGWNQISTMYICLDLGFTRDEVCSKFVSSSKHTRFTTIGRVALALAIASGRRPSNTRISELEKLLYDNR